MARDPRTLWMGYHVLTLGIPNSWYRTEQTSVLSHLASNQFKENSRHFTSTFDKFPTQLQGHRLGLLIRQKLEAITH